MTDSSEEESERADEIRNTQYARRTNTLYDAFGLGNARRTDREHFTLLERPVLCSLESNAVRVPASRITWCLSGALSDLDSGSALFSSAPFGLFRRVESLSRSSMRRV